MADKKQMVFPGDALSTAEEFSAGKNAAEMPNGKVVSTCVGMPVFDPSRREAGVSCSTKVAVPVEPGSTVLAKVVVVRDTMVMTEIEAAEKNGQKQAVASAFASIPVRLISGGFVTDARDLFKVGDIIKARVENVFRYGTDLTTAMPELGVIKAYCAHCRSPLKQFGADLKCMKCGSTEQRKISTDYALK